LHEDEPEKLLAVRWDVVGKESAGPIQELSRGEDDRPVDRALRVIGNVPDRHGAGGRAREVGPIHDARGKHVSRRPHRRTPELAEHRLGQDEPDLRGGGRNRAVLQEALDGLSLALLSGDLQLGEEPLQARNGRVHRVGPEVQRGGYGQAGLGSRVLQLLRFHGDVERHLRDDVGGGEGVHRVALHPDPGIRREEEGGEGREHQDQSDPHPVVHQPSGTGRANHRGRLRGVRLARQASSRASSSAWA
jgi:hypothetical protein